MSAVVLRLSRLGTGRVVVLGFFAALLAVGLGIYRDYGISWDELDTRALVGLGNYRFFSRGDRAVLGNHLKYYGPAFEVFLVFVERKCGLASPRSVFLMRHLLTFLLFYLAVVCFYRLLRGRFRDWRPALAGCLFLVLSPRIFAESFYNHKDLAFLSCYLVSMYTLVRFLRGPSYGRAAVHALSCAVLIDVRVPGVFIPVLTLTLVGPEFVSALIRGERARAALLARGAAAYVVLLGGLTVLGWPALWENPVQQLRSALTLMSKYPWLGHVLYQGAYVRSDTLPWHYFPVWLAITPPAYLALFAAGLAVIGREWLRHPLYFAFRHRADCVFLLCLALPVAAVLDLRPVLYDGWRHMFYVYGPFVAVAAVGFAALCRRLAGAGPVRRIAQVAFLGATACAVGGTALFMVRNHPHQNVYFNAFAARDAEELHRKYELDYWGLSYRRGLEYILAHGPSDSIPVLVANDPGRMNALLLAPEQQARLRYTDNAAEAVYFLSNYRSHPEEYDFGTDVFSVRVDGLKILTVQKRAGCSP
jgi:hypothetical protein